MLSLAQTIKMFGGNFKVLFSALGIIQRGTTYKPEDVVFNYNDGNVDYDWFLICAEEGETGADEIVIPDDAKSGDEITDGTVKWTLEPAITNEGE